MSKKAISMNAVSIKTSFKMFISCATIACVITVTGVQAETLRVTTAAPNGTPWVGHLEKTATNIKVNSSGSMSMEVFPASQLGAETETIKQTARGRLDAGIFSVTAVSTVVPEIAMLVTPFFWDNFAQADCALDDHLTDTFGELFEKRGLRIVQWQELGWQVFFSNEKVSGPSDVKGLKMRVAPSPNHDIYWQAAQVSGVPLPFSEIASGLQTGLIDGGELPTISYVAAGIGKLSPHMIRTRHVYQPSVLLMSTKTWKKLNAKEQKIFNQSMEPAQALRKAVRGAITFFSNKHIENGGTIQELNDQERAQWAGLWTDDQMKELIEVTGGQSQRIYNEVVKARQACTI